MYKTKDYLRRGTLMLRNSVNPTRRKVATVMIYTTDLCDSRCKHCKIWEKRPVQYLPKETIFKLMESKAITKRTNIGLEGGEFFLHPEAAAIMDWFSKHHPNFDVFSNCLKPDLVIDNVRKYKPSRLFISLDGTKETYKEMRGKDGYDKVLKVIETLKDEVPISVMFCLSPFNCTDDLAHVAAICKKNNIDLRVGVYSNIEFFDTDDLAYQDRDLCDPPEILKAFSENYDYLLLYNEWKKGNVQLPCKSIMDQVVVLPNGDVPICLNLDTTLGNLHESTLDEIIGNPESCRTLLHHHYKCNACWINFHRKYDVILYKNLEKFFSKGLISKMFGYYQWSDNPQQKYKQVIKELEGKKTAASSPK